MHAQLLDYLRLALSLIGVLFIFFSYHFIVFEIYIDFLSPMEKFRWIFLLKTSFQSDIFIYKI